MTSKSLYLLVNTSIWFKSFATLSASLSICFLGISERRRIFCFLDIVHKKTISCTRWLDSVHRPYQSLKVKRWMNPTKMARHLHYLAVAKPKRIDDSWYLSNWISMDVRWLLTPQIMIWSSSITCTCAPSLTLCIWFCRQPGEYMSKKCINIEKIHLSFR